MAVTKAQLFKHALHVLGVLANGQSVSAEDADTLEPIMASVVALLATKRVIALSSELAADAFPDELLLPLGVILARHAAATYGISGNDLAVIKVMSDDAEDDIRAMFPSERGAQPTPGTYF